MKRVKIDDKPKTILGKAFRVTNPEGETFGETYVCERCGNEIVVQKPKMIEEASLVDLLKLLVLSIPRQKCTMQDSINAFDFMQQSKESQDGVLALTDGIHDWLKKAVKENGTQIFGVNANAIEKALENFERVKESKGK